jgi:hypothetical protein
MTDTAAATAEDRAIDALTKILESSISPEMVEAQQVILRRLALSGDLFPSRVPAPANITQVGGYLNLIANDAVLRAQVLSSVLGVAGPNPSPGWEPALPPLYLATRANDRPDGPAQAAVPVTFSVRIDFAPALDAAIGAIHASGGTLPILSAAQPLPPAAPGVTPPVDLHPYIGRVLQLVPGTALATPATDPLALGSVAAGPLQLVSRQIDSAAPNAATVTAQSWSIWTCAAAACTQATVAAGRYIPLAPILNAAGWYQPTPTAPTSLAQAVGAFRWTNVTGLVAQASRFGDELSLIHSGGAIAQSSVRAHLDWVWDGSAFVAPA